MPKRPKQILSLNQKEEEKQTKRRKYKSELLVIYLISYLLELVFLVTSLLRLNISM